MHSLQCQQSLGRSVHVAIAMVAMVMSVAACGSQENPGDTTTSGSSGSGGHAPSVCAQDPRAQAYAVGLENKAADGTMKIRFMDSLPAPPAKGNNTWTVQVLEASDQPVNGATITTTGFMPDHGHGSSSKPTSTPMGSNGTYEITPMNLFMPGVWQITMSVQPAQGVAEAVVFTFCIDG